MTQITGLTSHPKQVFTMQSPTGQGEITFRLQYRDRVSAWYLDIESPTLTIRGFRLSRGKNVLDQYRRTARFGITIITTDRIDPCLLSDWETGRAVMYLLDQEDTDIIHDLMVGDE